MGVLRLLVLGTRRGWGRLAGIVAGVAVGVVLALLLIAGSNALEARDLRAAWLQPTVGDLAEATARDTIAAPGNDIVEGNPIKRLDVAVPPGGVPLPDLAAPAPGTFAASPAMTDLLATSPALTARYGTPAGTVPASMLAGPDSLVVVVGRTPAEVGALGSAGVVETFDGGAYGGQQNYQTLALVGALALLIPAFLLVSVSTTLGAAARAERWQTLLTIGASRRLVRRIGVVEAAGTALLGAGLGVAAFVALRPLLALLPVAGARLVVTDLRVGAGATAALAVAVVAGAVLAAAWATRRAGTSTGARVVAEAAPSPWRLAPLGLGLVTFVALAVAGDAAPIPLMLPVLACFALLALGLLVAGPYLTWLAGRLLARSAGTGATVIASRRIVRTPRAGFRSVAGLVVATFLISVFAFGTTAHAEAEDFTRTPLLPPGALAASVPPGAGLDAAGAAARIRAVPGVTGVYFARTGEEDVFLAGADARALTGTFTGATAALVGGVYSIAPEGAPVVEADVPDLDALPIGDVIVTTDGAPATVEAARTALLTLPGVDPSAGVWTRAEALAGVDSDLATQFTEIGRLAIGIVTALAAAVLSIATIAALHDRKRTLGLLQLIGMPARTLRSIISWETLVPLLAIVAPAVLLGWLTAYLLLSTLSSRTLGVPDSLLPISLGATAVMALASIALSSRAGLRLARAAENTHQE